MKSLFSGIFLLVDLDSPVIPFRLPF
jgi:hypothetical protein